MRQIEKNIVGAFIRGENARMDNTESKNGALFLHGNPIAMLGDNDKLYISNAGWQTRTTQSRLNAVLTLANKYTRVYTRNHKMRIDSGENDIVTMNNSDWYLVTE